MVPGLQLFIHHFTLQFFSLECRFSAILFILEFDANSKRKINLNLKNNHCYSIHWTQTWFRNTVGYDYDYMMWCGILEHFNFNIFEKNYLCQMEEFYFLHKRPKLTDCLICFVISLSDCKSDLRNEMNAKKIIHTYPLRNIFITGWSLLSDWLQKYENYDRCTLLLSPFTINNTPSLYLLPLSALICIIVTIPPRK